MSKIASPSGQHGNYQLGNLFLIVGMCVSVLGCAASIVSPLIYAWFQHQAGSGQADQPGYVVLLNIVGPIIAFCLSAALFIVFMEILDLRRKRAFRPAADRDQAPPPMP